MITIILNPASGRGKGQQMQPKIETALRKAGTAYRMQVTERRGEATELARRACLNGSEVIVAVGGDGTVNEVVNGLVEGTPAKQTAGKLAVLPMGTGNDFADMVGLPRNLDQAVQRIVSGHTRLIDVGWVEASEKKHSTRRYFDNNMGVGLEAWVTLESYKLKRLRGPFLYVVAALRGIMSHRAPHLSLTWETGVGNPQNISGSISMVSVGNSRRNGGGFYITPEAEMDDGLLDVAMIKQINRLALLALLPKAMHGKHTTHPAVTLTRTPRLSIVSSQAIPVQLDGEIIAHHAHTVEVGILAGKLEVIV